MSIPHVTSAIIALHEAVREEWGYYAGLSARHARVAAVARAMCEADGFKPDDVVMGGNAIGPGIWHPCHGARGSIVILHPLNPQWALYISQATVALDAIDGVKDTNGT